MSVKGKWHATTGFNTDDYTVTLGKSLDQCTLADFEANPLVGSVSPYVNQAYTGTDDDTWIGSYLTHLGGSSPGFLDQPTGTHPEEWGIGATPGDDIRKQYRRTIFIARPYTGVSMPSYCITENTTNLSRLRLVEDIDYPNKLVINYGNTPGGNSYVDLDYQVNSVPCMHTCDRGQSAYSSAPSYIDVTEEGVTTSYYIHPVWLYVYENEPYLICDEYLCAWSGYVNSSHPEQNCNGLGGKTRYQSFSQTTPKYLMMGYNPNNTGSTTNLLNMFTEAAFPSPIPSWTNFNDPPKEYPTTNLAPDGTGVVYGLSLSGGSSGSFRYSRLGVQLFQGNQWYRARSMCRVGCYFVNNGELLKPIVSDGIVIGYGTPDEESEIDRWTDLKHPVPSGPGGGGGGGPADDEDNKDPVTSISAPFATGLAHYYITTAASQVLGQIAEAMSTWDIDTSKKDLYRNLISCKLVKPPAPVPSTPGLTFEIYGVAPEYEGSPITITGVAGNPTATFGPYSISRKFNDFRDFAPYSKAEIFLPYCGWCALPSHVIGRSVYVKYFTDIIAATCKAVVYCYDNPVAEAAGVIGLDIPFAAENVGAKMEAANAGLLASTTGAVQTAIGVGTMVSTKGASGSKQAASGLSQYISGFTQMSMAANENWTEICGKNGDGCCLAGLNQIIIKITRPKFGQWTQSPYVPAGYAHNIGYTSMRSVQVGSVTGFLQCDNVDTSGIAGATDRERQLIKNYLESGVIVNHPEE